MSENNLREFVRWKDTDPLAISGQLQKRVKDAVEQGHSIGFAAVLIQMGEDGQATYTHCHTTLPTEVLLMCSKILERRAESQIEPV